MSLSHLLSKLDELEIQLWVEAGKIKYKAPKGAVTSEIKSLIRDHKTKLIGKLSTIDTTDIVGPHRVDNHPNKLPLSFAQERLWILNQLQGEGDKYHIQGVLKVFGELDLGRLQQSIDNVVDRHDALQTRFDVDKGKVYAIKDADLRVNIQTASIAEKMKGTSLNDHLPKGIEDILTVLAKEEYELSFDLTNGPLLRVCYWSLPVDSMKANRNNELPTGVLCFTMHHIISDGWSLGVFKRELSTVYSSLCMDKAIEVVDILPPLPIQYSDFSLWQRSQDFQEILERQQIFWAKLLENAPALSKLSPLKCRPQHLSANTGAEYHLNLNAVLTHRIKTLAKENGATLFSTLLAVFSLAVYRFSGDRDFMIGTNIANRNYKNIEPLIGFFVNTLALRFTPEPLDSFVEYLRKVSDRALLAFENQDLPFDRLVDTLNPERNASHNPIVQLLFVLQNTSNESLELSGVKLEPVNITYESIRFDMALHVTEVEDQLQAVFRYQTSLFPENWIRLFAESFAYIAECLTNNPGLRVGYFPIEPLKLDTDVIDKTLDSDIANGKECDHEEHSILKLFDHQSCVNPDKIALVVGSDQVTYKWLSSQSNRLAHKLIDKGIERESLIGVVAEKSVESVVALLAILKSGAAYLPIDPSYPRERIKYIVNDSGCQLLIGRNIATKKIQDIFADGVSTGQSSDVPDILSLCRDEVTGNGYVGLENYPSELPAIHYFSEQLAYVIYTSGSTGNPKGVEISHGNLFWSTKARIDYYEYDVDSFLLMSSFSFDSSIAGIFWTLACGGRLVLPSDEQLQDPQLLKQLIVDGGVTHTLMLPSYYNMILESGGNNQLGTLRCVIVAGEVCSLSTCENHNRQLSHANLFNEYGPTEGTVWATAYRCGEEVDAPPIGRSISSSTVYVVDEQLNIVPYLSRGQLALGGRGLARGYLNKPRITAERFLPNKWCRESGARLYLTGDKVQAMENGCLDYIGRIDNQVKVRGYRIELEEIEHVISIAPQIADVAVIHQNDGNGLGQLYAFVTLTQDSGATVDAAKRYVEQNVPAYMMPHQWIALSALPINANGKIDRNTLISYRDKQNQALEKIVARDSLESYLVSLWQEILSKENIGINENFFALGGDSLKAVRLVNELQRNLKSVLYVVAIFDAPTIEKLAKYLRNNYEEILNNLKLKNYSEKDTSIRDVCISKTCIAPLDIIRFNENIKPVLSDAGNDKGQLNPRAVFILSPPRSGSTLLRIMMAGNPKLFAPPELELLQFKDLNERSEILTGREYYKQEGLIRAVMSLRSVTKEEAENWILSQHDQFDSVLDCYKALQHELQDRILVDKTVIYSLNRSVLQKAEDFFEDPLFIHLVRHPAAMINSFVENKFSQVFYNYDHEFNDRQLAELTWLTCHDNIVDFLNTIPKHRKCQIHYEKLVESPEETLRNLSQFLGVDYVEEMINPYGEFSERMTDPIHPSSKMVGDQKFHSFKSIQPQRAVDWQNKFSEIGLLTPSTIDLSRRLGISTNSLISFIDNSQQSVMLRDQVKYEANVNRAKLSFAQQRFWTLDKLNNGNASYNIPVALRFKGGLDLEKIRSSFITAVKLHPMLRTCFVSDGGEPCQIVNKDLNIEITQSHGDLNSAKSYSDRNVNWRFDLSEGPLLRVHFHHLAIDDGILFVCMPHIIADGWSMEILLKTLSNQYNNIEVMQYSLNNYFDYVSYEEELRASGVFNKQLNYWIDQLSGSPPLLNMPVDYGRQDCHSSLGATVPIVLDKSLVAELKRLAQTHETTLFTIIMAAFQLLLARYSGDEEIVVGTPVAGRNRPEFEEILGCFINTLAIRTRISSRQSFTSLIAQVRETVVDAFRNQDVPFEAVVEGLGIERRHNNSPVFQTMLTLLNTPSLVPTFDGLSVQPYSQELVNAKYDLSLSLMEKNNSLFGSLEYKTALFKPDTIERFAKYFHFLLQSIIDCPDRPMSELSLITSAETQKIIAMGNSMRNVELPDNLIERFCELASLYPQREALSDGCSSLTYYELNEASDRLAQALNQRGVGNADLVGLFIPRSFEFMIGLLGILKVGAAYVPIDMGLPRERLRQMSESLKLVVESDQLSVRFPRELSPAIEIESALESQLSVIESQWESDRDTDLACVLFTSGSTGRAKGVKVSHRGIARLACGADYVELSEKSRLLQLSSLSFDVSTFEIWGAWLNGGCCVLYMENETHFVKLAALIAKARVNVAWFTTSLFNAISDQSPDLLKELEQVLVGGEALSPSHISEMQARYPSVQFINGYGPTEMTTFTTSYRIECQVPKHALSIPIGKPITNTKVYILDDDMYPVPIGIPGELYGGGDGVALGYLNEPDLTREKFVANPFAKNESERLYKTGDRVRLLEDGNIDYLGRIDNQVKIRGFRVEFAEIYQALLSVYGVSQAAVNTIDFGGADKEICAYFTVDHVSMYERVGNDDCGRLSFRNYERKIIEIIKKELKEKLPRYMHPSHLQLVSSFPLNRSGKIDNKLLPLTYRHQSKLGLLNSNVKFVPKGVHKKVLPSIKWLGKDSINESLTGIHFFNLSKLDLVKVRECCVLSDTEMEAIVKSAGLVALALLYIGKDKYRAKENKKRSLEVLSGWLSIIKDQTVLDLIKSFGKRYIESKSEPNTIDTQAQVPFAIVNYDSDVTERIINDKKIQEGRNTEIKFCFGLSQDFVTGEVCFDQAIFSKSDVRCVINLLENILNDFSNNPYLVVGDYLRFYEHRTSLHDVYNNMPYSLELDCNPVTVHEINSVERI